MAKKLEERNPITVWEITAKNPTLFKPNNKVVICGKLKQRKFEVSHRQPGTSSIKMFRAMVTTKVSGNTDVVPVIIPETLLPPWSEQGQWIAVAGTVRIHRERKNGTRSWYKDINVLASECYFFNEEMPNENIVYLEGNLAKDAFSYNEEEKKKEITLMVERLYAKDYIPCVAYGKKILKAGYKIALYGRFQSREYHKRISENLTQTRTAYEIVANSVRLLN